MKIFILIIDKSDRLYFRIYRNNIILRGIGVCILNIWYMFLGYLGSSGSYPEKIVFASKLKTFQLFQKEEEMINKGKNFNLVSKTCCILLCSHVQRRVVRSVMGQNSNLYEPMMFSLNKFA